MGRKVDEGLATKGVKVRRLLGGTICRHLLYRDSSPRGELLRLDVEFKCDLTPRFTSCLPFSNAAERVVEFSLSNYSRRDAEIWRWRATDVT